MDVYSYRVCYTFLINYSRFLVTVCDVFVNNLLQYSFIFEFSLIYLFYVLFLLKVEGNFERSKSQPKRAEGK